MGWIGYVSTHFTKSGNINRKAECDAASWQYKN